VGPRAGLDGCGKSRRLPGFIPRTVQPVASRYTDSYPGPYEEDVGRPIYTVEGTCRHADAGRYIQRHAAMKICEDPGK
jgi:hypothetical protein